MNRVRWSSFGVLMALVAGCGSTALSSDGGVVDGGGDVPGDSMVALDTPAVLPDAAAADVVVQPDVAVGPDEGPPDRPPIVERDAVSPGSDGPHAATRNLDLLFMIDNSPSMKEEQANLIRNFPVMINELKKLPGGLPNLHVAVVTSDLGAGSVPLSNGGCPRIGGDRGIFHAPNCGLAPGSNFLTTSSDGALNNFQGDLQSVFNCMASVGDQGCGYEHQLQATRVALYEAITPENKGFLRDDAMLAIVLISDEDDCSAQTSTNLFVDDATFPGTTASFRCAQVGHLCDGKSPALTPFDAPLEACASNENGRLIKVAEVVDSIKVLKSRPAEQIVVAGIFGWPNNPLGARYRYVQTPDGLDYAPICQSVNGEATAGLRLKKFVESFGNAGAFFSICNDDFSPAMQQIGSRLAGRF
jgi:hypothetical protein